MHNEIERHWEMQLREWRAARARLERLPRYRVLNDRTLRELARRKPRSLMELASIPGIGKRKLAQLGLTLIDLCERIRSEAPAPDRPADWSRRPPNA